MLGILRFHSNILTGAELVVADLSAEVDRKVLQRSLLDSLGVFYDGNSIKESSKSSPLKNPVVMQFTVLIEDANTLRNDV